MPAHVASPMDVQTRIRIRMQAHNQVRTQPKATQQLLAAVHPFRCPDICSILPAMLKGAAAAAAAAAGAGAAAAASVHVPS
jgi:hypothetical protein